MGTKPRFEPPVRTVRLSDQVTAKLQSLITESHVRPGEKLPSERELCELLGVSRTVVREAVRTLVVKGMLDVRPGGGAIVRAPDPAIVSELMTVMLRGGAGDVAFAHIQEVRRLLEVELAGLAAQRHNETDVLRIEGFLAAMVEHQNEPEQWAAADVGFHKAIAVATHNPLYPVLLDSVAEMLVEVRLTGIQLPETPQKAFVHHTRILDRIKAGDRAGARKAMQSHLQEAEDTYKKAHYTKTKPDR